MKNTDIFKISPYTVSYKYNDLFNETRRHFAIKYLRHCLLKTNLQFVTFTE